MAWVDLKISVDLGSDSVKVGYAWKDGTRVQSGRLCLTDADLPMPSLAYYHEAENRWDFGEDVYQSIDGGHVYRTVVKIKDLLSLLNNKGDQKYYRGAACRFPKFYFPKILSSDETFAEKIQADRTFCVDKLDTDGKPQNPAAACQMFVTYLVKQKIEPALKQLSKDKNVQFLSVQYILVYSIDSKPAYRKELCRLFEALGNKVATISSPKAIALHAYDKKLLSGDGSALIFDIGETLTSVAKINYSQSIVNVDSVDAHNPPIKLGGASYDEALKNLVDEKIEDLSALGASQMSEGEREQGSYQQQFLLMDNIKRAKATFSADDRLYQAIYARGVPITAEREVTTEVRVRRGEFALASKAVMKQMTEYVKTELGRLDNKETKQIIFAGGAAASYGLTAWIETELVHISIIDATKKDVKHQKDPYLVVGSDNLLYAAAIGAAIYLTDVHKMTMVAAYSYGTWYNANGVKRMKPFLKKGQEIVKPKYADGYRLSGNVENDEIFLSTTTEEIDVGEPGSGLRKTAEMLYGLKVLSGGKNGRLKLYKVNARGEKTEIFHLANGLKIPFEEGIMIDEDGHATPFAARTSNEPEYRNYIVTMEGFDDFMLQGSAKK